jgi:L-ascorbate metabolism protein UlaG (beta-lactamase superfamily)
LELTGSPSEGEALVRYLGHSGWSVRTARHFLVFDYHEMSGRPDEPCLANGFVVPEEIKSLPVTVFSTHEHRDHYDTLIFGWRESVPNITYVLGHQPADQTGYEYIPPRESRMIGDMKVTTIHSTDAGVGYIVEVDGLTIFHAGDHSAGTVDLPEPFRTEIDFIGDNCPRPDLAFLPISGCSLGTPESVKAGAYYIIDNLHPRVVFPQHRGNAEYDLALFEQEARERGVTTPVRAAGHRGDVFDIGPSVGI